MAIKTVEIDNLINGQLYGFRMFPRNLKGQYQTRDDKGTATATPVAFSLPTYTGIHAIFGDTNEGRIEIYDSGTLTLSPATYDMFVVGGGGGGGYGNVTSGGSFGYGGSGGGGGYCDVILSEFGEGDYQIQIGVGGIYGDRYHSPNNGGITKIVHGTTDILNGNGGFAGENGGNSKGGDGGSGGGGGADAGTSTQSGSGGDGGSDGSDGKAGYGKSGIGSHTTTRAFGEETGTLYAGGGGGGSGFYYGQGKSGKGGDGGGGNAGNYETDKDGIKNTGGGGGGGNGEYSIGDHRSITNGGWGGSGIAIIRWKNN